MLTCFVASGLARAEIFKWVDERGVVNYGSAPPSKFQAKALDPQASAVSVLPAPPRAAAAEDEDAELRERLDRLESELEQQQRARVADAEAQARQEEARRAACERDRVVDCDAEWRGGVGYPGVVVVRQPLHWQYRPMAGKPGRLALGIKPVGAAYDRVAPHRHARAGAVGEAQQDYGRRPGSSKIDRVTLNR